MFQYKRYERLKDSGVEWIGEIPEAWNIGGLTKYVRSIVDYRGKTPEKVDGGVFLVTAKNIKKGKIDYSLSQEYVKSDEYEMIMRRGTPELGDVVFTTEAPLGEVANIDRTDIALAQRVIKFRGIENVLNNYYLKYWMLSHGFQSNLHTFATGSTATGIKASKLSKLIILLPTYEEQTQIVKFLNQKTAEIESLITEIEMLIASLEEQKQAIVIEAVTKGLNTLVKKKDSGISWIGEIPESWEIKKVKHKFLIQKRINTKEDPVVLSLTQKGIKIKDLEDYSGQHAESYLNYQVVNKNDFVMNSMDLLTGFVDCSPFDGVTSPDYRVFTQINPNECHQYFLYYFQMCYFAKIFYGHGQGVSKFGRWRLQTDVFKDFPVMIPPINEQFEIAQSISAKIEEIDELLQINLNFITKLQEYRQSVIYEAVTGKIDVRESAVDQHIVEENVV